MKNSIFTIAVAAALAATSTFASANDWHRDGNRDGYRGRNHGGHHRPPPDFRGHNYHNPNHGRIWHRNQWHPRPLLRFSYRPLPWGTMQHIYRDRRYVAPPVGYWACYAESNGYYGNGTSVNVGNAQEYALLNCGPACTDGTYQMSCAPVY